MKRMIKYIQTTCIVVLIFYCISCTQQQVEDRLPVDAIAVPVKNGWGYEIYVDNKLFIKQDYIPAVNGIHQFEKREQALATAKLVLAKMKAGKKPYITVDELKHVGVNITN